jgi:hypothetical protein
MKGYSFIYPTVKKLMEKMQVINEYEGMQSKV